MGIPAVSTVQRQTFVASLDIPDVPASLRPALFRGGAVRGEEQGGFVDAGSLVSFVSGLSGQTQSDVLNSTMLAQLSADKKFDREQQTDDWYRFYRTVLEHTGWVLQEFVFTKYDAGGQELEVDKAVLKILAAIATQNELAILTETIDAAKSLADGDGRITLFDHFSATRTMGCFQVGIASETNGAVALKLGAFRITSTTKITKILWFRFSTQNTQIYKSAQAATLNLGIYSQLRLGVEQKLGERAKAFLAGLDV